MTRSTTDKTRTRHPHGAASLSASPESKRLAAAILEVLAGIRTPADAARALGTSIPRYYHLEQRALEGLLQACQPRPQGRRLGESQQIGRMERELSKLQKECQRLQALARVAQRTMGLSAPQSPPPKVSKTGGKKGRVRRPAVRALRAAAALRIEPEGNSTSPSIQRGVQPEVSAE